MITQEDRKEIIRKGQEDGGRLLTVVDMIYKISIIFNWILAIAGGVATIGCFIAASNMGTTLIGLGVGILICTLLICLTYYVAAVLATHGAKVLVHLLFSNLAIMEDKNQ